MMRAFLAVEVSSKARDAIAAFQDGSKPRSGGSLRWVRPEVLHLTLRFLGEVDPAVLAALCESLRGAVVDCEPFTYSLRRGGCFPDSKRARVVWVGVEPVPDALVRLHRVVESAVARHGFPAESRGFNPHLTIARVKTPDPSIAPLVASLDGRDFGETDVSELVLFESRLSRGGASYHFVERFVLGGR